MIKSEEIKNPTSCLNKAADDEPIFVLRAKDPIAAYIVDTWVLYASGSGQHEESKLEEAIELAKKMRAWRQNCLTKEPPKP